MKSIAEIVATSFGVVGMESLLTDLIQSLWKEGQRKKTMPQISRQTPNTPSTTSRNPASSSSGSSILSRGVPIAEVKDDSIKMVIYGQNRVGKTTLACQFPKPLLLIAMEPTKTGGARSVSKVKGVTFLRIESSREAVRLAEELRGNTTFKTVVVDSVTSYQDIILKEILNLPSLPEMLSWGTVSQDQYRERSEKTREALRPYLNLACHVVLTAKEKDHNPPSESRNKLTRGAQLESFFAADLGGATVGWLHDACDYIARLYIDKETITKKVKIAGEVIEREEETGKSVRRLRTMYHPNYAAGFRSANPERVPEYIDNPSFDKIYSIIEGG